MISSFSLLEALQSNSLSTNHDPVNGSEEWNENSFTISKMMKYKQLFCFLDLNNSKIILLKSESGNLISFNNPCNQFSSRGRDSSAAISSTEAPHLSTHPNPKKTPSETPNPSNVFPPQKIVLIDLKEYFTLDSQLLGSIIIYQQPDYYYLVFGNSSDSLFQLTIHFETLELIHVNVFDSLSVSPSKDNRDSPSTETSLITSTNLNENTPKLVNIAATLNGSLLIKTYRRSTHVHLVKMAAPYHPATTTPDVMQMLPRPAPVFSQTAKSTILKLWTAVTEVASLGYSTWPSLISSLVFESDSFWNQEFDADKTPDLVHDDDGQLTIRPLVAGIYDDGFLRLWDALEGKTVAILGVSHSEVGEKIKKRWRVMGGRGGYKNVCMSVFGVDVVGNPGSETCSVCGFIVIYIPWTGIFVIVAVKVEWEMGKWKYSLSEVEKVHSREEFGDLIGFDVKPSLKNGSKENDEMELDSQDEESHKDESWELVVIWQVEGVQTYWFNTKSKNKNDSFEDDSDHVNTRYESIFNWIQNPSPPLPLPPTTVSCNTVYHHTAILSSIDNIDNYNFIEADEKATMGSSNTATTMGKNGELEWVTYMFQTLRIPFSLILSQCGIGVNNYPGKNNQPNESKDSLYEQMIHSVILAMITCSLSELELVHGQTDGHTPLSFYSHVYSQTWTALSRRVLGAWIEVRKATGICIDGGLTIASFGGKDARIGVIADGGPIMYGGDGTNYDKGDEINFKALMESVKGVFDCVKGIKGIMDMDVNGIQVLLSRGIGEDPSGLLMEWGAGVVTALMDGEGRRIIGSVVKWMRKVGDEDEFKQLISGFIRELQCLDVVVTNDNVPGIQGCAGTVVAEYMRVVIQTRYQFLCELAVTLCILKLICPTYSVDTDTFRLVCSLVAVYYRLNWVAMQILHGAPSNINGNASENMDKSDNMGIMLLEFLVRHRIIFDFEHVDGSIPGGIEQVVASGLAFLGSRGHASTSLAEAASCIKIVGLCGDVAEPENVLLLLGTVCETPAVCYLEAVCWVKTGAFEKARALFERAVGNTGMESDLLLVVPEIRKGQGASCYYQKVMEIFAHAGVLDYAVSFGKKAASCAMDPEFQYVNQSLFKCSIECGDYKTAYESVVANRDPQLKRDCLEILISELCDSQNLGLLCGGFSFAGMQDQVEESIFFKCRTEPCLPLRPSLFHRIGYAYFVYIGDYRNAAGIMFRHAVRLYSIAWNDRYGNKEVASVYTRLSQCLLAAINALLLVDEDEAYLKTTAPIKVYNGGTVLRNVLRVCDLRKMYQLSLTKLKLFPKHPQLATTFALPAPRDIFDIYCRLNETDQAIMFACLFEFDLMPIVSCTCETIVRLINRLPCDLPDQVEFTNMRLSPEKRMWLILRNLLSHDQNYKYHEKAISTLLNHIPNYRLPNWLIAPLKNNGEILVRLYMSKNRISDALSVALETLSNARRPLGNAGTCVRWIPLTIIEQLMGVLSKIDPSGFDRLKVGLADYTASLTLY